jgi:protein-tyrosine-phosphatase
MGGAERRSAAQREPGGDVPLPTDRPLRVLFLCTGNSARSQIAETILKPMGRGRFVAESAGAQPAARVNPLAIEALNRHGYFWTGHSPRGLAGLEEQNWDFVITVCDRAKEACPIFPGQPVVAHWGMPDPAAVEGTDEERQRAFNDALLLIRRRLDLFVSLPIEKLTRLALEQRMRGIGEGAIDAPEPSPSR